MRAARGEAAVVRIPALGSVAFPAIFAPLGTISIVGSSNDYQVNMVPV